MESSSTDVSVSQPLPRSNLSLFLASALTFAPAVHYFHRFGVSAFEFPWVDHLRPFRPFNRVWTAVMGRRSSWARPGLCRDLAGRAVVPLVRGIQQIGAWC